MSDIDDLGREILDHLGLYKEFGVKVVARRNGNRGEARAAAAVQDASKAAQTEGRSARSIPAAAQKRLETDVRHAHQEPRPSSAQPPNREDLEEIRRDLGDCRRCKLAPGRRNIVFGAGNPDADLMFVGEAPGADEDRQGLPFVGRAGQLLTKIIAAMDMSREEVYICNILKCRPPGNRNPETDEIVACGPFLLKQIASIRPKVICSLGTFSAQTLLRTKEPISRLRGRFIDFHGTPLMATFHPAYLLRNPAEKRKVWEDVQKIMRFLNPDGDSR